jgi:transposase-like protein
MSKGLIKMPLYVCSTCGQDFTRKYNANRHNQNIHFGKAEIVRFLEYLVGRISGKYLPGTL